MFAHMGLFSRDLQVELLGDEAAVAGRRYRGTLVARVGEVVTVSAVRARVTGRQGWRTGSGKHQVSHSANVPTLALTLAEYPEATQWVPDSYRFPFAFELPADMPASHEHAPAHAYLELEATIAIPWRCDPRWRFLIPVRRP